MSSRNWNPMRPTQSPGLSKPSSLISHGLISPVPRRLRKGGARVDVTFEPPDLRPEDLGWPSAPALPAPKGPRYRVKLTVSHTGYAEWNTEGDPEQETESDDVAGWLSEQVTDRPDFVDVEWNGGRIEQQQPDGSWGEVDWDAIRERELSYLVGREVCCSIGPRIGLEGSPRCRLEVNHPGFHRPAPDDGFFGVTWGDPLRPDLALRRDLLRAGIRPITEEEARDY